MQNGGGFEGGVFLGKGLEKGLEASGVNGMGLESSRATALRFVLVIRCHGSYYDFLGKGMEEGLEASGEHGKGLESSKTVPQLQDSCWLLYTDQCYEWYCILSSAGQSVI
jgi:hypothetical protein